MLTPDQVRQELLAIWGRQTCQVQPQDWPQVLARLMRDGGSQHSHRGRLKAAVDEAVAALTAAFAGDPPADPADTVWRAFPRLDLRHRTEIARRRRRPTTLKEEAMPKQAVTEHEYLQWRVDHMTAWVEQERAKNRPETELTWGNCIRETGVLTERSGKQFITPRRGTLVPPPVLRGR
jgi:hypothetical protein